MSYFSFCMNIAIEYIKQNNLNDLQKRLNKIDINVTDDNDNNLLHYSIKYHRYEISYYLINKGINLNIINKFGYTPLSLAVKNNLINIVTTLIDNNANPFIYNSNLEDSIYLSYLYGRENIILYFENKYEYDLNKSNKFGQTLHFAIVKSHNIKLIKKYININNIYIKDKFNNTLLIEAVRNDDYNTTEYLLDISQININMFNNNKENALSLAIMNRNKNMIKLLLSNLAFTQFYLANIDYNNSIKLIDESLLDYDLTNQYSIKYKLIYYLLQNDITNFKKNINYNNIYIKDNFNKNVLDYIKIYNFINKNNKFYQVLCHLDKKLI